MEHTSTSTVDGQSSKTELVLLSLAELHYLRPHFEKMLAEAEFYSEGELTADDLLDMGERGLMQFWIVGESPRIRAVLVTEMAVYPRMRALRIIALAGEGLNDWIQLEANLEIFARQQGCLRMEAFVRPGMAKALLSQGYTSRRLMVSKRLFGGWH